MFKCIGCGNCCRLSPITLLPHEVHMLRREARRLNIDVKIKPGYMVYDAVSKSFIILSYHLELDDKTRKCPFLTSDNKCLLHGRYKPYTCKSFPYVPREIHYIVDRATKTIAHRSIYGISTACLFVKQHSRKIEELVKLYGIQKIFPNEYKSVYEAESWRKWYMAMLTLLWKHGLINLYSDVDVKDARIVNAYDFIVAGVIVLRSILSRNVLRRD